MSKHSKKTATRSSPRRSAGRAKTDKSDSNGEEESTGARRAVWSGSVGFGLLQIPVSLYPAVKPAATALHQLDRHDFAPIRYKRVNEHTGEEVAWDDIVKGYQVERGRFIPVEDEDLERVKVRSTHVIELRDFVSAESILPVYYETPYVLAPSGRSPKAYVLFREALRNKGLAAIGTFVLRTREHLVAIFPMDEVLVLEMLRFSQELRTGKGLGIPSGSLRAKTSFSERELSMAEQLIENMRAEWKPSQYRDTYSDALVAMLEKKAKTGKLPPVQHEKEPRADVVDLMALLKKSIAEKPGAGRPRTTAKRSRTRERAA